MDVLDALLGQVDVDDKEAESFGAALLAAHQVVHPAAGLQLGQQAARTLVTYIYVKKHYSLRNKKKTSRRDSEHFTELVILLSLRSRELKLKMFRDCSLASVIKQVA